MSLTNRLSLFFLAALGVVLCGFSVILYLLAHRHLNTQADHRLDATMHTLTAAIEVHPGDVEWEPLERKVTLGEDPSPEQVRWMIHEPTGRLIDCSGNLERAGDTPGASDRGWRVLVRRVRAGNFEPEPVDGREKPSTGGLGDTFLTGPPPSTISLPHDRTFHGDALILTVAVAEEPVQGTLAQLAWTLTAVSGLIWLTAAVWGRWLCRRALRPIARMALSARALRLRPGEGEFLEVAPSADELEDLGRAFNELLAALRESLERQRRFTGDASHQLRTPLAALLAGVEVALRHERPAAEYQRVLGVVQRRGIQLRQIIESLLFLARAEVDSPLPDPERVDLVEWCRCRLDAWGEHPRSTDLHFDPEADAVSVLTHPALLGQILDNLLDNACKYSDARTPVTVATLTPVVVFIPLAFIDGIQGVFFRALAITMVVSLLTSLVLAVALTPTLAARFIRVRAGTNPTADHELGGPILRRLIRVYEWAARRAIRWAWFTAAFTLLVFGGTAGIYFLLKQDFLPEMDEGAFVIDYQMPPGTALSETDRVLKHVEQLLLETPEVESYSRRTGARLALAVAEPHRGDFLVKLKPDRKRSVDEVKDDLRDRIHAVEPVIEVDMPGILGDLIGDLTWSPKPIEIKVFSADVGVLKEKAGKIAELIDSKDGGGVDGVVDVNNGLMYTGSALVYRPRWQDLMRYGVKSDDVARTLNTALLGETPSAVLEGDRLVNIRLLVDPKFVRKSPAIDALLVRSELGGSGTRVSAVASRRVEAGQLELRREDLRQNVAVTARTSNRDLGSAIRDIKAKLDKEMPDRPGFTLEYGGLYQQQQESFRNLVMVMAAAVLLVFLVLLIEFRSLLAPLAIVWGSMLSLFGVGLALWLTDTSLNIISFLGAIIGLGIVAKNGILMLDRVEHLRAEGMALDEALVWSGRRRLRPVLMTSLAAALGMLPLAYGIGSGADMLKPLAIAVMGALAVSVLLSLIATPAVYYVLMRTLGGVPRPLAVPASSAVATPPAEPKPLPFPTEPTEPSANDPSLPTEPGSVGPAS